VQQVGDKVQPAAMRQTAKTSITRLVEWFKGVDELM
jgi:hypothetical protein